MDRWICPIPFYPQGLVFGGQSPREPCKTTSVAAASGAAYGLPVCLAPSLMLARAERYISRAKIGPAGRSEGAEMAPWESDQA